MIDLYVNGSSLFTTQMGNNSSIAMGYEKDHDLYFIQLINDDLGRSHSWRFNMSKKQAQDVCNGIIATAHQEFRFSEKKRELIRNAIKRAECMEIDYSGMSSDEVQELDDALDLIFACARLLGGETHEKHQDD